MSPHVDTTNLVKTVKRLIEISGYVFEVTTKGFSHEESLKCPKPSGNNVNWIAGHLIDSRNSMLRMLGAEPVWPDGTGERYKRGTDPLTNASEAESWEKLAGDFKESQKRLMAALDSTELDVFNQQIGDATIGEAMSFLSFHETYHVGQLGLLRRLNGKEGVIK